MIRSACPLCDADDPAALFVGRDHNFGFAGSFPVVGCRSCGLIYCNPYVGPDAVGRFFDDSYAAHDAADRPARVRRGRDPWDRVAPFGGRRLLDLGCGGGSYLARMQAAGWHGLGIDPVDRAIASCRSLGVEAIAGTIPGVDLGDRRFELITLRGSLPNLPEPRKTFAALRAVATPETMLIANAFNSAGLMARRCGPQWLGYDLPRQRCHYAPDTLTRLLNSTGWNAIRVVHRRRPNLARRNVRIMALATGRRSWRCLAANRWLVGLVTHYATWTRQSDDICVVARPQ